MHAVKSEDQEIKPKMSKLDRQRENLQGKLMPLFQILDKTYQVQTGKEEQVIAYALNFFSKNQKMKFPRIARKVAEHFRLELKGQQDLALPESPEPEKKVISIPTN